MPYLLFVVARDGTTRFEYITRHFADEPQVEVIYDRRVGERRVVRAARPTERRSGRERRQPPVRGDLNSLGWVLVTRPAAAGGSGEGSAC
jgi:hypothetical protein